MSLEDLQRPLLEVENRIRDKELELSRRFGQKEMLEKHLSEQARILEKADRELILLAEVAEVLQALSSLKKEEMKEKIEDLVTFGLRSVFKENLTFRIDTGVRAKQSTMEFRVVSMMNGKEVDTDILNSHGGGLVQIISLLLRIVILLFARPSPARVLILDETLAHLSREYLEPAAELLRTLCDKLGLQILMVSHSPEIEPFADVVYRFSKGSSGVTKVAAVSGN